MTDKKTTKRKVNNDIHLHSYTNYTNLHTGSGWLNELGNWIT